MRSDGIVAGEWLRGYSDMEPCLVLSIRAPYLARVDGQETAALPAPTPFFDPRPQKLNKALLNETQRRARGSI